MNILFSGVDSELIKDITSTLNLLQPDWRVSVVNSGKECLNIVKSSNCPDVIIMSTKLSDLSGFKLTGYIRDDSDIPIIFISDDENINTLVKAFDSGVDDYIVSPFNRAIFIARLKALIRRHIWDFQTSNGGLQTDLSDRLCVKDESQGYENPYTNLNSNLSHIHRCRII